MFAMKTTLDIPDKLYREFKAKTATNGEKMRSAVISFIVAYNAGGWPQSATRERQTRASQRTRPRLPEWAGMAVPFIKRYPGAPLDTEKMRDEIVAARKAGLK